MPKKWSRILPLVVALVVLAACVPRFDPITVENLAKIKDTPVVCAEAAAYERAKKDAGDTSFDKKTVKHYSELCECLGAAGTNMVRRQACFLNIPAYIAYEHAKKRR